jgi:hypothetical protein
MTKTAGFLTQTEIKAVFRGAIEAGAKRVELEVSKDRKNLKVIGYADLSSDATETKETHLESLI